MLVRVQGGDSHEPVVQGIKSLMVCTDDGTPIGVYMDIHGKIVIKHAKEPGFDTFLAELGFPAKVATKVEL